MSPTLRSKIIDPMPVIYRFPEHLRVEVPETL